MTNNQLSKKERILKAIRICIIAHQGQFRADGVTPFSDHPIAVMRILLALGLDEIILIISLFHDIFEDCNMASVSIMIDFLEEYYPNEKIEIWSALMALTKISGQDRGACHDIYFKRLSESTPSVRIVKLADRYHNIQNFAGKPEGFKEMYLKETKDLLKAFGAPKSSPECYLQKAIEIYLAIQNPKMLDNKEIL